MKATLPTGVVSALLICAAGQPAWADQWTAALTPLAAQIETLNGVADVYLTTAQAVVNPAGCLGTDGYVVSEPLIVHDALAIALTAITASHQVQLYVSSSQCARNRPMVLSVQMNP